MFPWTFVTNHLIVLRFIAQYPMITGHELALEINISERAIRRIIAELYEGGYITKQKEGRRVRYKVKHHAHLKHITQRDKTVGDLLKVISAKRQNEKNERPKCEFNNSSPSSPSRNKMRKKWKSCPGK